MITPYLGQVVGRLVNGPCGPRWIHQCVHCSQQLDRDARDLVVVSLGAREDIGIVNPIKVAVGGNGVVHQVGSGVIG